VGHHGTQKRKNIWLKSNIKCNPHLSVDCAEIESFRLWLVPSETHMRVWISRGWQEIRQRIPSCKFHTNESIHIKTLNSFNFEQENNFLLISTTENIRSKTKMTRRTFFVKFPVTFDWSTPACVFQRGPKLKQINLCTNYTKNLYNSGRPSFIKRYLPLTHT